MVVSDLASIRNAALRLLAQREHSKNELVTKLSHKFSDIDQIDSVLLRLTENGLQSDERFVESFIRAKKSQGKGPRLIKHELKQKGVSEYLIASYVYEDDESWMHMAATVYAKKFGDKPISDDKDKAKRIRFMVSRGFSSECVYKLVEGKI